MPVGYVGPLSHAFRYVTVDMLRAEGIKNEDIPEDRARDLIALCSNWINWLTQQWFVPVRVNAKVDGRNCSLVHLPCFVPILQLDSLHISKEGLFDIVMPDISYVVKERIVQMVSYSAHLPNNPRFVRLDGVFGWLEDDFALVRTTLSAPVNPGDWTIQLTSVTGISPGDVLLVGRDPYPKSEAVIVDAIRGNEIVTEPIRCSCLVGDVVVRYGRIPRLIQWATMLMVKDKRIPIGIRGTDADTDNPKWFAERLQSESVEGYSYSLAQLPTMYGHAGGSWTTGSPETDDILQQYSCPNLYIGSTA